MCHQLKLKLKSPASGKSSTFSKVRSTISPWSSRLSFSSGWYYHLSNERFNPRCYSSMYNCFHLSIKSNRFANIFEQKDDRVWFSITWGIIVQVQSMPVILVHLFQWVNDHWFLVQHRSNVMIVSMANLNEYIVLHRYNDLQIIYLLSIIFKSLFLFCLLWVCSTNNS